MATESAAVTPSTAPVTAAPDIAGQPMFEEAGKPLAPVVGEVHAKKQVSHAERIAAQAAKGAGTAPIAAAAVPAAATAAVAGSVPAKQTGSAGTGAAPVPAAAGTVDVTDQAIAAAAAKQDELEAAKAAAIGPPDDFAARVKQAEAVAGTDPLKALELLGIKFETALKQAQGLPADAPDELSKAQARIKELETAQAAAIAAEQAKTAAAQAQASHNAMLARVVADPQFPNLKSPEQVEAAFASARSAAKLLEADLGRPMNQTEADRLALHYLKQHDSRAVQPVTEPAKSAAAAVIPIQSKARAGNLRTNVVQPVTAQRRTLEQIKADIRAGKKPTSTARA